ncbi:MAG: YfbK domain-containing protein [Thalassotalea sp.]
MKRHNFALSILASGILLTIISCSTQDHVAAEQEIAKAKQQASQQKRKSSETVEVIEVQGIRKSPLNAMQAKRAETNEKIASIFAEDIGKTSDNNIAQALSRVTGITVEESDGEGTTIMLQGAGTSLNDVTLSELQMTELKTILHQTRPDYANQIFKKYGVNPTIETKNKATSTFSMDVDTASYKLASDMLNRNRLPNTDGIRIEEFINAMTYQYAQSNETFGISAQILPSPYRKGYHVLHLGLQTKQITENERKPSNLVLVADVSGSMQGNNLAMLKNAFTTLVSQLNSDDTVSIVTYSDNATVLLPATRVNNKRKIVDAINSLYTQGSTNAAAGIKLAYQQAEQMFVPGFNNRVILTSDGMANIGSTSPEAILNTISKSKDKGVFLTTVGVGTGNYNDHLLEQLANQGNGNYLYIGDHNDIQENFVDGLSKSLQTVAKDAKVQIKFNPQAITEYRLLGYENRHLAKDDFTNPDKDGGEIGAGHSVTVLYEVKLNNTELENLTQNNLATVAIAYKKADGIKQHYLEKHIPAKIIADTISQASPDSKLSIAAAAFAEKLRQTYWARAYQYQDIINLINQLPLQYKQQTQVKELLNNIQRAQQLDNRGDNFEATTPLLGMNFSRVPLLD